MSASLYFLFHCFYIPPGGSPGYIPYIKNYHFCPLFNCFCQFRGGSRIFFRRGCTRLLLYFNTNKPHSFCRIPVVLENRRSSQGGGAHPLHPTPRSAPAVRDNTSKYILKENTRKEKEKSFDIKKISCRRASHLLLGNRLLAGKAGIY